MKKTYTLEELNQFPDAEPIAPAKRTYTLEELNQFPDAEPMSFLDTAKNVGERVGNEALAAGLGAADAITFGYLPQVGAGIEQGLEGIGILPEQGSYVQNRDRIRNLLNRVSEKAPVSSIAGTVGGALIGPGLVAKAAKGAGTLGRMAAGALTGGANAVLSNPGETEGEISPVQMKQRLDNMQMGGAFGAVLPAAGAVLSTSASKVAQKLPESAKKLAEKGYERIARGLNPRQNQTTNWKNIAREGRAPDLGRTIEEFKLFKGGMKPDKVLERTEKALDDVGFQIGDIIERTNKQNPGVKISRAEIGDRVMERVLDLGEDLPGSNFSKMMQDMVQEFSEKGDDLTFNSAQDLKVKFQNQLSRLYRKNPLVAPTEKEIAQRMFLDTMREALDDAVLQFGDDAARTQYNGYKEMYRNLKNIRDIAEDSTWRAQQNRSISPSDYYSSGTLGTIGAIANEDRLLGAIGGAAIGFGLNRLGRLQGQPMVGRAQVAIADGLNSAAQLEPKAQQTLMLLQRIEAAKAAGKLQAIQGREKVEKAEANLKNDYLENYK
jgi:hypothetical protein